MTLTNLESALAYAARGWRVYRVHTIVDGKCSCKRDCGKDAGKHPVDGGGFNSATSDTAKDRDLFGRSIANVGIAPGQGLVVLDVDPRNGGDKSLAEAEALHGPLPKTPTVATGGGGKHFYFRYPAGAKIGKGVVGPGLELLGDGGAVVAPPSLHASGNRYAWLVSPEDAPLAEAPAWLLAKLAEAKAPQHARAEAGPGPTLRWAADPPGLAEAPGVDAGDRHEALCVLVGRALGQGQDPAEVEALALAWAEKCDPPLAEAEVIRQVRSLAAKHERKAGEDSEERAEAPAGVSSLSSHPSLSSQGDGRGQAEGKGSASGLSSLSSHPSLSSQEAERESGEWVLL